MCAIRMIREARRPRHAGVCEAARAKPACSGWAWRHRPLLSAPCRSERRPSRRPSARWPSWCGQARCGISGCRKRRRRRSAAPHAIHPIAALQTEYSLWTRDPEDEHAAVVRELGIGFVAYSPLGRGFLTGRIRRFDDLAPDDYRRNLAPLSGRKLPAESGSRAADRATRGRQRLHPPQLALAWVLAQGERHRADPRHQAEEVSG